MSAAVRVAVLDDYQAVARDLVAWQVDGHDVDVVAFSDHLEGEDLVEALQGFGVVVAMRERTAFTAGLLRSLPALRLLISTGMQSAVIDFEAARECGVAVCGTRGLTTPAVEMTWALILAAARHLGPEERSLRSGEWQSRLGYDLSGSTLGMVGLGRHGSEVARIGLAFGMRVVAWSHHLDPDRARSLGVEPVTKERVFREADIVTVHYKLGERSRGLVGSEEFELMKKTALFINTSRGPVVDVGALGAALHTGRIAGAALDVYDEEPLPVESPLRDLPGLILTPHIGFVTTNNLRTFYEDAVEDIARFLAGDPVRLISPTA